MKKHIGVFWAGFVFFSMFMHFGIAGDGQIDIAVLPYSISVSGSYIVTANLSLATQDTNGITIDANNVSLDLNGHTLTGAGKTAGSSGSGIYVNGAKYNINIKNGAICQWREAGVWAYSADNSIVEDLRCYDNGGFGIAVEYGNNVFRNTCYNNGQGGISAGASTVSDNTCRINGGAGIYMTAGGTITNNTLIGNTGHGISGAYGGVVIGNKCENSGNNGIELSYGTIKENSCRNNAWNGIAGNSCVIAENACCGNTQDGINSFQSVIKDNICSENNGDGIEVSEKSIVEGNNCTGNGALANDGAGIFATSSNNRISRNHCIGNDRGLDLDGANNMISENTLRGNAIPIDAVAGNQLELIISEIPYTISYPGSYRLIGDLTIGAQNLSGITISANNVTLDLGGHALIGSGKAAGSIGNGIYVTPSRSNLVIRNGTVRDWRENGINGANTSNGRYEGLFVFENGGDGLYAGYNSNISDISSYNNEGNGIKVRQHSIIQNAICYSNLLNGIHDGEGYNTILQNNSNYNGGDGIYADMDSVVTGNSCIGNTGDGIEVRLRCSVLDNLCDLNGNSTGDGAGVNATAGGNRIERNQAHSGDRGIDCNPATGNFIAANKARSNTTDYDIAAGNTYGQIVDMTSGGQIAAADPFANFRF